MNKRAIKFLTPLLVGVGLTTIPTAIVIASCSNTKNELPIKEKEYIWVTYTNGTRAPYLLKEQKPEFLVCEDYSRNTIVIPFNQINNYEVDSKIEVLWNQNRHKETVDYFARTCLRIDPALRVEAQQIPNANVNFTVLKKFIPILKDCKAENIPFKVFKDTTTITITSVTPDSYQRLIRVNFICESFGFSTNFFGEIYWY